MSQTPTERSTRRTEGIRSRGRSARVVQEVLTATAEELGRSGYAALRIEDVAERAGVNKTTIYRRWPTKAALVKAENADRKIGYDAIAKANGKTPEEVGKQAAAINQSRQPKK